MCPMPQSPLHRGVPARDAAFDGDPTDADAPSHRRLVLPGLLRAQGEPGAGWGCTPQPTVRLAPGT